LSSLTAKTAGRILSINTSNDAFSAKDVHFGVPFVLSLKKIERIAMLPMGKI